MSRPTEAPSIAAVLGQIRWDYSPADAGVGLLSPMSRYFRGFPWDGRGAGAAEAAVRKQVEDELSEDEPEGS
jgi:hypothetical protein